MATGTVAWFDRERGFGFIKPAGGGKDVFVHHSGITPIAGQKRRNLEEGQQVEYEVADEKRGPQAENVVVVKD